MTPLERDVLAFLIDSPRRWHTTVDVALATGHDELAIDWALRELHLADATLAGAWGMWAAGDQAADLVERQVGELSLVDVTRRLRLVPARALVHGGGDSPCAA